MNDEQRDPSVSCMWSVHWWNSCRTDALRKRSADVTGWQVQQGVMDVPRWSHATYAIQSVPNWKIFLFGGIGGEITEENNQGTFMNDISIFDTGTERWIRPDVHGDLPLPRGDMPLEYYHQVL